MAPVGRGKSRVGPYGSSSSAPARDFRPVVNAVRALRGKKKKPANRGVKPKATKTSPFKTSPMSKHQLKEYLDPIKAKGIPPALPTLGLYLCVTDYARHVVETSTTDGMLLVFSPTNNGVYNFLGWNEANGNLITGIESLSTSYKYRAGGGNAAPIAWRSFRASVSMQNISNTQKREGSVHVLNSSDPVNIPWANANAYNISTLGFGGLKASILQSYRQKTLTAEALAFVKHKALAFPVSDANYRAWNPTGFNESLATHETQQLTWNEAETWQQMSNILIYLPPTPNGVQQYEIAVCLQSGQRHVPGSQLGALQVNHAKQGLAGLITRATAAVADGSAMDAETAS